MTARAGTASPTPRAKDDWQTLECERALYVDRGRNVILCDRLPSPVTLVVKLRKHRAHD